MPKPSKQIIIDAIIKEIESGKATEKICAVICRKFQFSERTFYNHYKNASQQQQERQEKASKAADKVFIETKVESLKNGLKSKLEKQLELQKEIDFIDQQLKGKVQFTFVVGNKVNKSHNGDVFMLPVQVQNDLRARKLQYYAELNKMEGDYAPTKIANTDKEGNDITPLSEKQVDKILDIINNL